MAYIGREKFAEAICNFPAIDEDAANAVISLLHRQPTADVVEVVRCKDCKHYEIGKSYTPYCNNVMNLFEEMKPTDFCSYGEKER